MTGDDLVSLERIGDQLARIADALDSLAAQHGAPRPIAEPHPFDNAGHHVNYNANRRWPR